MKLLRLLVLLGCVAIGPSLNAAPKTQVRLVLSADSAKPGDTIMAGLEMRMPGKWHTYWKNGGDSGLATEIDWHLPNGISAGEILWPVPEKLTIKPFTTYVYHGTVLLLVPLKVSSDLAAGPYEIKAAVSWLECDEACLPGKGDVQAKLLVGSESKASPDAALVKSWKKKLSADGATLSAQARWEQAPQDDTRPMIIEWENPEATELVDFYPYQSETYEVTGETQVIRASAPKFAIRKVVKKLSGAWPKQIDGLIVTRAKASAAPQGYDLKLALTDSDAPFSAASVGGAPKRSFLKMLGLAFLGGLILNIMPCVLPVIALKILGFVGQSKEAPGRVRKLGLIYALGVLASFLVLAGLVIAVQQAGRAANWGMQFQNPQFLIGMTVLVTLVALNLFGLFEINLSGQAMGVAGTLASREGGAGAFFNGVLATALATPCTAPFLGVALGFAFAQSPPIIVLMFLTIGLGLAAPYVVLSWQPGWLKFLPKPGAWMEKFKIAMGFPMLATAVWLFWLAAAHFGDSGALWIGLFLVAVAMAAWTWGEFVQRGVKRRGLALAVTALLVLVAYAYILEGQLSWRDSAVVRLTSEKNLRHGPNGIEWSRWSGKAVDEARAAGRPVLVDFTADWCLTCQVNKKTSLEIPEVRKKLLEIHAAAFLGDHTHYDPAITAELRKYDRAGVPLVLVFSPSADSVPIVLPEVLKPGIVLDALDKAAPAKIVSQKNPAN